MAFDREARPARPARGNKRRKVCQFCAEKCECIDYKDAAKLRLVEIEGLLDVGDTAGPAGEDQPLQEKEACHGEPIEALGRVEQWNQWHGRFLLREDFLSQRGRPVQFLFGDGKGQSPRRHPGLGKSPGEDLKHGAVQGGAPKRPGIWREWIRSVW